jgi:hypothetical protein
MKLTSLKKDKFLNALLWKNLLFGSLLFLVYSGIGNFVSAQATEKSYARGTSGLYEMQFVGHVENSEIYEFIQNTQRQLFPKAFTPHSERKLAKHLEIYIAPNVVEGGVFTPPPEAQLSLEYTASFDGLLFPNSGCQIRRRFFNNGKKYVVILVDSSETPTLKVVETCLLGAIATALGEDLDGQPIRTKEELKADIRRIVDGG